MLSLLPPDYDAILNQSIAEIASAKRMGPQHSEAVLITARNLLDQALNKCRKTRDGEVDEDDVPKQKWRD